MKSSLLKEVKEHFSTAIEDYIDREKLQLPSFDISRNDRVLEVGCGVRFSFSIPCEKIGIDITRKLLTNVKNKNIGLIVADARFLPFKSGTFRMVIAVVLLHHLVGKTPAICKNNVEESLREMMRVSEKYVLIHELLAKTQFFSFLIFYVTLICAKLNVNLKILDIHDKVVTFFLDENTLREMFKMKIRNQKLLKWKFPLVDRILEKREFLLTY